jgi:hypothetical protein
VELISTPKGNRLRVRTRVAESGNHSRKLFLRTGLDVSENQARRLLNDIASLRAYLEQKEGRPVSEVVAANRWLTEVYDPIVAAIPEVLRDRLAPVEIFHEILEHRCICRSTPDGTWAPLRPHTPISSACSPRSQSRWTPAPALSKH